MVENLSKVAELSDKYDRFKTAASDLFQRVDSSIKQAGGSRASEEAPVTYKVTHKGGALVRAGFETTTAQVHQLSLGEIVTVVEIQGRRARIAVPVDGWVSTETREGTQIMRPCRVQRKGQQNEAFEYMFEQKFNRIKNQKNRSGRDPREQRSLSPSSSRSPSPRTRTPERRRGNYSDDDDDRYGGRGGRYDDGRDRASGRDRAKPRQQAEPGNSAVPKISAPGQCGGPTVLAPPPGSAGAPRPVASSSSSAAPGNDLLDMPAPAQVPAGEPGGFDLLAVDRTPITGDLDLMGGGATASAPQAGGFDPTAPGGSDRKSVV